MKKIIALLLAVLFILFCLASCKNEDSQPNGDSQTDSSSNGEQVQPKKVVLSKNNQSVYTVIIPSNAGSELSDAAQTLVSKLSKETGALIRLISDSTLDGKPVDSENEIIIGDCLRTDSQRVIEGLTGFNDYRIVVTEKNIVITSMSESATVDAVWKFLSFFKTDNITKDTETKIVSLYWESDIYQTEETKKIESFTIGGKSVNDFKIVYPSGGSDDYIYMAHAESLRNWIGKNTGYVIEVVPDSEAATSNEILIGRTSRAESNEYYTSHKIGSLQYSLGLSNGKVHIAGAMPFSTQKAIESFEQLVEKNKGTVKTLDTGVKNLDKTYRNNIGDYRFMQFNILNYAKGWGSDGVLIPSEVEIRKEIVAARIMGYSPDVIALCEAWDKWHEQLAPMLEGYAFVEADYRGKNQNRSPLVYKVDRFDLIASGAESIEVSPDANNRCVTWAILEDKVTKDRLAVFGTHFSPHDGTAGEEQRALEAKKTFDIIGKTTEKYGGAVVLMGDFNTMRGTNRIAFSLLENEYTDVFDGEGLDHIFYDPSRLMVAQSYIDKDHFEILASDHWPIIADVIVKK